MHLYACAYKYTTYTRTRIIVPFTPLRHLYFSFNDMHDALDWHNVTGDDVLEYAYDQYNQNVFWVYPHIGSASDKFVEVIYQRSIPDVVSADTFPINDLYSVAVKEWMLYSLWSSDNEQSPNYAMALKKLEVFFTLLGLKGESDKNSPSDEKSRVT